jgi:hypothetical protein
MLTISYDFDGILSYHLSSSLTSFSVWLFVLYIGRVGYDIHCYRALALEHAVA